MEEKSLPVAEDKAGKNSPFPTKNDSNKQSSTALAPFDLSKLVGKHTFCAAERLKKETIITTLFNNGKSVSANGFTIVYLYTPLPTVYPAQAGFSVPKKNFKHAVDRNRIKRLMREVYRLNKFNFYERLLTSKQQCALLFIYKGKNIPEYEVVEKMLKGLLYKLLIA